LRKSFIISILLFASVLFLFAEKEKYSYQFIDRIFSNSGRISANANVNIGINNENAEKIIEKSEYALEGYGISSDGAVTMDDEYFGFLYYEIEANPRKYAEQNVVFTGFVYRELDFQKNEIKVARIELPKCGSQEDQILGLMCISENASGFENDQWVTVKGRLIVISYINPKTNSECYKYYIEPESIEKIQKNSSLTL